VGGSSHALLLATILGSDVCGGGGSSSASGSAAWSFG
jgi:hypothetical protein